MTNQILPGRDVAWLLAVLGVFMLASLPQWSLPGLYYDEALDVVPAMQLLQGGSLDVGSKVSLGGVELPLMVLDYVGPTSTYVSLPFFAVLGPGLLAIRILEVSVAMVGLVAIYYFTRDATDRTTAGLTALLVGLSPSYVFWGRMGITVSFPLVPIGAATLWALWRWRQGRRTKHLYMAAVLAGLGLATKLTFIWFLFALGVAVMLLRETRTEPAAASEGEAQGEAPASRLRTMALSVVLFGVGGMPLWIHNLRGLGSVSAVLSLVSSQPANGLSQWDVREGIVRRLQDFGQLMDGSWFANHGGPFRDPIALPLFAAASIYLLVIVLRYGLGRESRAGLFALLMVGLIILASISIATTGGARQLVFLFPFPQLVIVLAALDVRGRTLAQPLDRISAGRRLASRLWTVPLIALVVAQGAVVLRYHLDLRSTGGIGHVSDAIYDLAEYLEREEAWQPVAMDWGFARNLQILSHGRINPIEAFGYSADPAPSLSQELEALQRGDPRRLYLFHSEAHTAFHGRREILEQVALARGKGLDRVEVFEQRDGDPVILVYRVGPSRLFEVPEIENPLSVSLGEKIQFLGYDLDGPAPLLPGQILRFTLYWRVVEPTPQSFHVFTHLVDAEGTVWAQQDHPPVGGSYPTHLWVGGEVVIDPYEMVLPPDLPPKTYELRIGMYDLQTLQRLPMDSSRSVADSLLLTTVEVSGDKQSSPFATPSP